jgi:hypothetical protein
MAQFTVPALLLRRAFETALAFAYTGDPHPGLSVVRIDPLPDEVRVSATDRYTASTETLKAEGDPFAVIVPLRVAERIVAMIPPLADEEYAQPEYRMVTFVKGDGDGVTVRAVGEDTATIAFTQVWSYDTKEVAKIFAAAGEADSPAEMTPELHVDPDRMADVMAAIQAREDGTPVRLVCAGVDKPLVLTQGSGFQALLMPVRVDQPRPTKTEPEVKVST